MNENIFNFLMTLIPVFGAIITYFVIPFIKSSISEKQLAQYKEWAKLAVKTAEMLWKETGHGEDKKAYVVNFLNEMFNKNKITITAEQLEVLIEAAVKEMKEIENK